MWVETGGFGFFCNNGYLTTIPGGKLAIKFNRKTQASGSKQKR